MAFALYSRQLVKISMWDLQLTASSPALSLSSLIDFSIACIPSLTSSTFSLATAVHHVPFSDQGPLSCTSSPSKSPVLKNEALPSGCRTTLVPLEEEAVGLISDVRPFCRCGWGTWTNDEFEADAVVVPSFDDDDPGALAFA
jgi:hypothetical protein